MAAQAPKNGFDKFHGLRAGRKRVRDCGEAQATSGAEASRGGFAAKGSVKMSGKIVIIPRAGAMPMRLAMSCGGGEGGRNRDGRRGQGSKKRYDPQYIKMAVSTGLEFFSVFSLKRIDRMGGLVV
jgi:hypothetical protein